MPKRAERRKMNKKEYSFELIIDGKEYVITLHYPTESKVTFGDIISKLLKDDVKKAIQNAE